MTLIPDSHPRAKSLHAREKLAAGLAAGVVTPTGLIAHGRGEAFDYLLGERTHPFADEAVVAASARLTLARHPVVSVNGNVAALAGEELAALAANHPRLVFEVNLFHYAADRAKRVVDHLTGVGLRRVIHFGDAPAAETLPGLDSDRRHMHPDGVARADVVLVALEDGDRCQALVASGRTVIAIDLNPLSRTARAAHVSVVDELTRCLPLLDERLAADRSATRATLEQRLAEYDNRRVLGEAIRAIRSGG